MESLGIDPLNSAVYQLFGLSYLFPYQRLVIANIFEAAEAAGIKLNWPGISVEPPPPDADGKAAANTEGDRAGLGRQIVILPTGAGKSLCFQFPAMVLSGPTLVIYPLLSLMADQERRLRERGFPPVLLRGGQSPEERETIWKKLKSGESRFIIANPEVLLTAQIRERLPELGIVHTVIDEAHCVSEWGESFRPAYLEIHTILEAVRSPLVTAFTATAGVEVLEKIDRAIFGADRDAGRPIRIIGSPDRPNIEYRARGCILRDLAVRDLLLAHERPAVVFCSSRPGTERLARYLQNSLAGSGTAWAREVRFYHAGLSREEKRRLEAWFFHNGEGVLVSTCAFGLGIDKSDIRTVIHRDCPPSVEAYLQESGRAGRDGKQSTAILLWGPEDLGRLALASTPIARQRLEALFAYARNHKNCRREALLKLLDYEGTGEKPETHCCNVCAGEDGGDLREEASLWDFFRRNKRCYTLGEAARVLAASETVHWSEEEAKSAVRELVKKGTLALCKGPFWKNKLTTGINSAQRCNYQE